MRFNQEFLKIYDRAIGSGVCSFSQTGIGVSNFNQLCMDPDFVLDDEVIIRACKVMKIEEEKISWLLELAAESRPEE
ncbi:MAG: hypothetical protein IKS99_08595 [Firmicutes bacterium]|nr:hypothetical protein [Bacillota bacterium]